MTTMPMTDTSRPDASLASPHEQRAEKPAVMVSSEPAKSPNLLLQQEDECSSTEDVPLNEDHMQVHGVVNDTTAKEDAHDAQAADFSVAQECRQRLRSVNSHVKIDKSQVRNRQ
jgi:hypothetical protein